jgi:hypothetical protein
MIHARRNGDDGDDPRACHGAAPTGHGRAEAPRPVLPAAAAGSLQQEAARSGSTRGCTAAGVERAAGGGRRVPPPVLPAAGAGSLQQEAAGRAAARRLGRRGRR